MDKVLVLDIDGVVVRGRPSYGDAWFATMEEDLGILIKYRKILPYSLQILYFLSLRSGLKSKDLL